MRRRLRPLTVFSDVQSTSRLVVGIRLDVSVQLARDIPLLDGSIRYKSTARRGWSLPPRRFHIWPGRTLIEPKRFAWLLSCRAATAPVVPGRTEHRSCTPGSARPTMTLSDRHAQ